MNNFQQLINTPWKAYFEICRILLHPLVISYLKIKGVKLGKNTKWDGFPRVFKHKGSQIIIGDRVEVRNWKYSNPLGVNHALILTTWKKGAKINIASDVGISGGSISATNNINIGQGTLVGANSTIIDTDFHPIKSKKRRYQKIGIQSSPITIGKNVFLGTKAIILKGVKIKPNSVIGAGQVVSR